MGVRSGPRIYSESREEGGVLLIHSDTTDGSTSFVDSSPSRHTLAASGNPRHETDYSKFGATSIFIPNAYSDTVGIAAHSDFEFTGDFTIDMWVNVPSGGDRSFYVQSDGSTYLAFNYSKSATQFNLYINTGGPNQTPAYDLVGWNHVAWIRSGDQLVLYVNGTAINTVTTSATLGYAAGNQTLNRLGGGASTTPHYCDEVRISKGIARWTENFKPPHRRYATRDLVLCLEAGTKGSVIAGDDIITGDDVTFSSDTGNWLDGGNWTISGGTASCAADGSNHYLDYNFAAVTGQKYKLTFETVSNSISNLGHVVVQGGVVANSAVNFEPGVAGNGGVIDDAGNYLGSLGVHSFTFNSVVTATDEIRIRCKSNASSGTIVLDNVTLVPITNKFIDSPAGKWFDLSGNGNVGTITNATYSSENVDVGTKYLDFDGTGDYVDFGSAIMGEVNSVATFCAWVSPSTTSGTPQDGIIGEFTNGFIFSTSSDSYGDLKLYDGTTNHLAPGGTVLGNIWSHCVITWQASGRCHMYHNGQEVYNAAVTATSFGNSPTNTRIGSVGGDYGSSSAMMNGKIATVQLYKAKLTHAQIKDMYNSQKSRFGL